MRGIYTYEFKKSRNFYKIFGLSLFLVRKRANSEINIYMAATIDICSIVNPKSIKTPKRAVPNAVEKTINAVVRALIEPMYFTPYISAHVADPRTFAKPLEIPIKPRKKNEEIELSK
tara:strand:+ start:709 stop:1059 length:351 start_codon:yes stop_codon:yes gene_type:complete